MIRRYIFLLGLYFASATLNPAWARSVESGICASNQTQEVTRLVTARNWDGLFLQITALKKNNCPDLPQAELIFAEALIQNTQEIANTVKLPNFQVLQIISLMLRKHHDQCLYSQCPIDRGAFFRMEGMAFESSSQWKKSLKSFAMGDITALPVTDANIDYLLGYAWAQAGAGDFMGASMTLKKVQLERPADVRVLAGEVFIDQLKNYGNGIALIDVRHQYGFVESAEVAACQALEAIKIWPKALQCYSTLLAQSSFANSSTAPFVCDRMTVLRAEIKEK